MSSAVQRMGVLYGRLGLSTAPALIQSRMAAVPKAADSLCISGLPELLRAAFGLCGTNATGEFLAAFSQEDPTFDVRPDDKEAALLAGTIAAYGMEADTEISGDLALSIVTVSVGGIRQPRCDDQLVQLAENMLAEYQGQTAIAPPNRVAKKMPQSLSDSIASLPETVQNIQFQQAAPHLVKTIQQLSNYSQTITTVIATSDNDLLAYIKRLEEEVRTYWWVAGAWSSDTRRAFRNCEPAEAAIRAGKELADKHSTPLGLFAAPALLDMVLERGRHAAPENVSLAEAAVAANREWRSTTFQGISTGPYADLLPISTMQEMAALSEDADDWLPRFKRLSGIDAQKTEITPVDLALQLYRERLTLRLLTD